MCFIQQDLAKSVKELATFLGKDLDPATVDGIAAHCTFDSMKANPMTNHLDVYSIKAHISPLLRKGKFIYHRYSEKVSSYITPTHKRYVHISPLIRKGMFIYHRY